MGEKTKLIQIPTLVQKKGQSKTETVSRCRSFLSQLPNKKRWVHIYTQTHKCLHLVTALPTCVTRAPHFDIRTTEKLLHDCPGWSPTAVSTMCILKLQDKTLQFFFFFCIGLFVWEYMSVCNARGSTASQTTRGHCVFNNATLENYHRRKKKNGCIVTDWPPVK